MKEEIEMCIAEEVGPGSHGKSPEQLVIAGEDPLKCLLSYMGHVGMHLHLCLCVLENVHMHLGVPLCTYVCVCVCVFASMHT